MAKRRRSDTREFQLKAVHRLASEGKSLAEVARELGLGVSLLRSWKTGLTVAGEQAPPRSGPPPGRRAGDAPPPRREPAASHGARDLEGSDGLLCRGVVMRYQSILGHRHEFPTRRMGRALEVPTGGSSQWRRRPPSARQARDEALTAEIKAIHQEVQARYGRPRIHAELVARGEPCCVNTVARLTSRAGVAAKTKRRSRCTTDSTHDHPVAEDVVDRQLEPEAPNRVRAAEITSIPTREGWRHLAAVEDLHSRQIVGWSMSGRIDSRLVVDALEMAVSRRLPGEGLVAHSGRGSQYAGEHDRRLLANHEITCGMSRRASCWDNAPMESFFASLEEGLVHDEDDATRAEVRSSVFEYIEVS